MDEHTRKTIAGLAALLLCAPLLGLAACAREPQGAAERAGKKIDAALQKVGDRVEKAGQKIESATDDALKKAGEGVEKAGEKIEDAADEAEKKIDEAIGDDDDG